MSTLGELAALVDGAIVGRPELTIKGVSEIQHGKPGTITFLANPKYKKFVIDTQASAILVSDKTLLQDKNGIVVKNPQLALAKILSVFSPQLSPNDGIHPAAFVDESAILGNNISIGAFAIIEARVVIGNNTRIGHNVTIGQDSRIGENGLIHPSVVIYRQSILGDRVIIHSGTVVGSDGFGFVTNHDIHHKIPQNGHVIIGNDVEIGANCAIDRATIGETVIGSGTKIDNLVHIAHNVKIGRGCLITGCVGIAGSVEIGNFCILAGQVGVAAHLKVGNRAIIAAKSGVTKSLPGGKVYAGMPAREIREQNKRDAVFKQITIIKKRLEKLEQKE